MFKYLLKGKSMCHFLEKKTTNYITLCDVLSYICFGQWSVEDEFHSLGNEAAAQSRGMTADTAVFLATWQQGEQTVAGVGVVFQNPIHLRMHCDFCNNNNNNNDINYYLFILFLFIIHFFIY